ncbi:hypothetical protein RUM44_008195 [Polyplax serrata]|uniref:Uncharacterized protein n=1 Tax=Polyplax serrata TaxID=468196 RepID=A0ABR1B7T8_POLSC
MGSPISWFQMQNRTAESPERVSVRGMGEISRSGSDGGSSGHHCRHQLLTNGQQHGAGMVRDQFALFLLEKLLLGKKKQQQQQLKIIIKMRCFRDGNQTIAPSPSFPETEPADRSMTGVAGISLGGSSNLTSRHLSESDLT